jgi:hypothetical protein
MSKQDEPVAAKAVPAISQAPPRPTPLPRGSYVAPLKADADRRSAETLRKISEAEFFLQVAERHCYEAISKVRNVKGVDERFAAYVTNRWSEVLRPELDRVFAKCGDVGMPADMLAELKARIKKLDVEWKLVCQLRQSVSSKRVPVATTGNHATAITTLAAQLMSSPDLKREDARAWCIAQGFSISQRSFQNHVGQRLAKLRDWRESEPQGAKGNRRTNRCAAETAAAGRKGNARRMRISAQAEIIELKSSRQFFS